MRKPFFTLSAALAALPGAALAQDDAELAALTKPQSEVSAGLGYWSKDRPRLGTYAVLGNHDVASTRDPFSRPADLSAVEVAVLLEHESVSLDVEGLKLQVAGGDPRRHRERHGPLADRAADVRILLVHFPDPVQTLAPDEFHVILAGHLHGGQICVPTPRGKVRLEHLRARYWEGLFELPQGTLHVSRGLGTSFVPFRFLARPEATILRLRVAE